MMLGYDSTLPVTMNFMVMIAAAARRGAPGVYLIADMTFLSYHVTVPEAIRNAGRFLTDAGAHMVKMEVTEVYVGPVKAVNDTGIATMAHIGIPPQTISTVGRRPQLPRENRRNGSPHEASASVSPVARGRAARARNQSLLSSRPATGETNTPRPPSKELAASSRV
jgi:hypothetical protein